MKSKWLSFIVVFSAITTIATSSFAAFEPLFQVIDITGECSLKRPKESSFSPAQNEKAYPYGTKIITGKRSSITVQFSAGNFCKVLADTNMSVDQDSSDKKLKIMRINNGEVEIELKEDFHKNGDKLDVVTATATCSAIGCKFRVASKAEEDLQVVVVRVIEGMIRVFGENFSAATLDESDWLSLLSPADRSFLRLKTMKGEIDVTIKDEDMQDKVIPTEEGTVLKIWQRYVPETNQRVVTVVLTAPDGTLKETFTVTYGEGQGAPYMDPKDPKEQETPKEPETPKAPKGPKGNPVVDNDVPLDEPDPDTPKDPEADTPVDPTPTGKR